MPRGLSMLQIDHWLLSRHVPGGRKFPELDCWGLVCDVYRSLGAELPEFADLSQSTMGQGYDQCLAAHVFYPVTVPEDFDLVAFLHRGKCSTQRSGRTAALSVYLISCFTHHLPIIM